MRQCDRPPPGWYCTRLRGHDGPCAAWHVWRGLYELAVLDHEIRIAERRLSQRLYLARYGL